MASGKSLDLNTIPKRTQEWVHQHSVQDSIGYDGKMHPTPVNRAERRRVSGILTAHPRPNTTPYEKEAG